MDTNFEKVERPLRAHRARLQKIVLIVGAAGSRACTELSFAFICVHSRFKIKNRSGFTEAVFKSARIREAHFRTLIYKVGALK